VLVSILPLTETVFVGLWLTPLTTTKMQLSKTFALTLALFCASQHEGALGTDVPPGCKSGEFSDCGFDETVLVQTKTQQHRRQAKLGRTKLQGLVTLTDAVTDAMDRMKDAADTQQSGSYGAGFLTSATIMFVFAYFYKQHVIEGPPSFPKVNSSMTGPRRGLFTCLGHPQTCLHVTFCMPVVAAKNYHATDVLDFWPSCIVTFLSTYSPLYCIAVVIRAILSGRVQDKLGVQHSCCWDMIYAFFLPCDVGRESMEIDQEVGADIECCCTVSYKARDVAEEEQ